MSLDAPFIAYRARSASRDGVGHPLSCSIFFLFSNLHIYDDGFSPENQKMINP